jgi:S1-C subfamily serine protease
LSSTSLPEGLRLDFTWEFKENSDHWPLFEAGVPSLIVHTGLHDDYHTPRDDFEKVNLAGIRSGTTYLLETVCRLADAESLPTFRSASRSENVSLQRARQAPLPPAPGRLGILWSPVKNTDADEAKVIQVDQVVIGSPAAKAGVVVGDHITAVDGREISDAALLPAAVLRAEKDIELTIVRHGGTQELVVPLDGAPVELGISWREDDAEPGVVFVTRVIPYSPAARAGLAVHDRIYALDGELFADGNGLLQGIQRLLAENAESMRLEVETAGSVRTVDVDMRLPGGDQDQSL